MEYGLIGGRLSHSFSKPIHEQLAGYSYELCPLPTQEQARAFLAARAFKAINVTIPYKQLVMEYCDALDPAARAIGAVNTVVNRGGRLYGYNTDLAGFLYMLRRRGISLAGKTVMLLGTGGTQKTVAAAARGEGARSVLCVSRTGRGGALTYEQAAACKDVQVLVNTSPVGMYPNVDECLVDLAWFPRLEAVADVVYNPFCTVLLEQAQARGIPAAGGLPMLVAQAKYAAEYFTGCAIPDERIEQVYRTLRAQMANLVLIGMPSSGKTALGRACAQMLGKRFVDLDEELEKRAGKPIPEILFPGNETAFRDLESRVLADTAKESGLVIATGGGAILREENVRALRRNGIVVYIDRPLEQLTPGGGRPLSQGRQALEKQYAARAPLYSAACHAKVRNDGAFEAAAGAIKERFYEVLDHERA